jgi:hypothetical protein
MCRRNPILVLLPIVLGLALPVFAQSTGSKRLEVETRSASSLGLTGLTVNGSIQPHGLPTTYYFEYGPTTSYGNKTRPESLPPRLAAYYKESWNEGSGGWHTDMTVAPIEHHREGGAQGGFVRFHEPARDDPNHVDCVGTLHLPKFVMTGPWARFVNLPSLQLGAGDPDFRDARVSLYVRGNNWVANGSELQWWNVSWSNVDEIRTVEEFRKPSWRAANWTYTATNLNDQLASGRWEKVDYRLRHDSEDWTYAGNNRAQPHYKRYSYWPLNDAQRHLNADFFHILAFVDPVNPPKGSIDFDELVIAYRNYSLVLPSNGGKLLRAPKSPDDPATLTDGWRNGPSKTWRGPAQPSTPVEIVYTFANPVTVRAVQLHQNPDWPARDVEVFVSSNDRDYTSIEKAVLPEKGVPNANFAFALQSGLAAEAKYLKVQISSGYKKEHWGLGEIEVFGSGATMQTDDDRYFVNLDLHDLKPGTTLHYRLVAENNTVTIPGADRMVTLPANQKPLVRTDDARRVSATTAQIRGRLNPLGLRTEFYFEYGPDTSYGLKSPKSYGGLEITPRLCFANLTGLKPASTYHYRLVATNEKGTSQGADAVFQTKE